jgi:hypothetical protein
MAISPMYFQPLSPQQANPLLYGLQQGTQIAGQNQLNTARQIQNQLLGAQLPYAAQMAQQRLRGLQIGNSLNQNTLNFAPQTSQAALNLTGAQTNAQNALPGYYGSEAQKNLADANLTNAQVRYLPLQASANADPLTKLLIGQKFARDMLGNSNGSLPNMTSNNGGMTIQPGGQPQPDNTAAQFAATGIPYAAAPSQVPGNYPALPGGLNQAQGNQLLQRLNSGAMPNSGGSLPGAPGNTSPNMYSLMYGNALSQMTKNPTMGSYRSGAGGTYTNPATGQSYTTDTNANATLDQRTVAALQRVTPILNSLSKNLSPFQTATGEAGLRIGQALNYGLGTHFQSPDMYAQGQSDLKVAPESLLRAWGLPITNESLNRMQEAVEPRFGESSQGYQTRIVNQLKQLQANSAQSQQRLQSGQTLNGNNSSASSASQAAPGVPDGMVKVQTPDGQMWNIPSKNLNSALQRGAKQL